MGPSSVLTPPAPPRPVDPVTEVDPYTLFARLVADQRPILVDTRRESVGPTFRHAVSWTEGQWTFGDADVVLFDGYGRDAAALAARLHDRGHRNVRALYGGLALYDLAIDPAVVGHERFLDEE